MHGLATTIGVFTICLFPWEIAALDYEGQPPNIERAQDIARVAELIAPTIQNGIDGIAHVDGRTYKVSAGDCWFVVVLKHSAQGGPITMAVLETNCP